MQFNSETNNDDLYSDTRFWCGIASSDTTTYPLADFTRNANRGLDAAVVLIQKADARWKWDDDNYTDLPIATTNLVTGQDDYALSITHLKVRRVRIMDANGTWITLDRKTKRELKDVELNADDDTPQTYDIVGSSLILNPSPNYNSTDGLEVQFQRGASYFTTTDTTKKPGFASQFHRYISLCAAEDYCAVNDLTARLKTIQDKKAAMAQEIEIFYAERDEDEQPQITFKREDYGESALG